MANMERSYLSDRLGALSDIHGENLYFLMLELYIRKEVQLAAKQIIVSSSRGALEVLCSFVMRK